MSGLDDIWKHTIPAIDDEMLSCAAEKLPEMLLAKAGRIGGLISGLPRNVAEDPESIRQALEYALKNARLNGRSRADFLDLYFGLLLKSMKR
jgi:hypothetical protein